MRTLYLNLGPISKAGLQSSVHDWVFIDVPEPERHGRVHCQTPVVMPSTYYANQHTSGLQSRLTSRKFPYDNSMACRSLGGPRKVSGSASKTNCYQGHS